MEGNLFTVFATMVNFVILILVLKHFLFSKISDVIDNRNNETIETINNAEDYKIEAQSLKKSFEKQIATLENKGREIVKEAKVKADSQAKDIIHEAEEKASLLLKQAENEIQRLNRKAVDDLRQEIGALAILAAEKILEKNLDHKEQQEVIGKIIDEAGNEQWQN
jgi:F-type H+-transporting ATPase subunit b